MDHFQGNAPLHRQVGGYWRVDPTGHHHHSFTSGTNRQTTGPLDCLAGQEDPVEADFNPQGQVGMVNINLELVRELIQQVASQLVVHRKGIQFEMVVRTAGLDLKGDRVVDLFFNHLGRRLGSRVKGLLNPNGWGEVLDPKDQLQPVHYLVVVRPVQFNVQTVPLGVHLDLVETMQGVANVIAEPIDERLLVMTLGRQLTIANHNFGVLQAQFLLSIFSTIY